MSNHGGKRKGAGRKPAPLSRSARYGKTSFAPRWRSLYTDRLRALSNRLGVSITALMEQAAKDVLEKYDV